MTKTRKNTRHNKKNKTRFFMKGCSKIRKGGSALVGSPWTPKNLPGLDGIGGNNNYYSLNTYKVDVPLMMKVTGGKRSDRKRSDRKKRTKKQKGGYLYGDKNDDKSKNKGGGVYQSLNNLGRDAMFNVQSAYNTLSAEKLPISPSPVEDQYTFRS